ncbi:MAG: M91 family zinc metallopeptidase [Candidatus Nanopelagicales bacterium]
MTTPSAASAGRPPSDSGVLSRFPGWVWHRLPSVLATAVGAAVVGWVVNVWLMAVRYDGSQVPAGSAATGSGNFLQGTLFWAVLSMVLFSLVGYRRAVGGPRFWRELRGLPRGLAALVRADGAGARIHLLWGAAAGMAAAALIGPALGLALSLGILVMLPSLLGNLLSGLVSRAIAGLRAASASGTAPGAATTAGGRDGGLLTSAVGILGSALALALAFVLTETAVKLAVAFGLLAIAVALSVASRTAPPPAAVLVLVALAGIELLDVLLASSAAWADDGGYYECGESWAQWWSECAGSEGVRAAATAGGAAAAVGGVAGSFLGETAGSRPPGGDPVVDWVDGLLSDPALDDFLAEHPDTALDADGFEQYVTWREENGLPVPPIPGVDEPAPLQEGEGADGAPAEPETPTMILSGSQAMDVLRDLGLVNEVRDPDGSVRFVPTSRLDDLNADGDTFVETATSTDEHGVLDWVQEARITAVGGIAYTHDDDGNITSATIIAHTEPPTDWTHVRQLGDGIEARGTTDFTQAAADAHDATVATAAGQTIADDIAASGQRVTVRQTDGGNSYQLTHWDDGIANADGTNARGTGGRVNYNPDRTQAGSGREPWHRRPNWIGYAHELAHARDSAQGGLARGRATDAGMPAGRDPAHWQVNNLEMQATSIGPWAGHASDENAIRAEVGEPRRDSYVR